MTNSTGPYLVSRRDDGYGDVFPLQPGQRTSMGRAATNRIVLKDDELCSREHAEVYFAEGRWRLRDLKSLNGTRINGNPLEEDWELVPGDEIQVGRSPFLFVSKLEDLPEAPKPALAGENVSIKKRLGQTRFMTPLPLNHREEMTASDIEPRHTVSRDLSLLYRLALDMGTATTEEDLARAVLDGLFEGICAEVGAVLIMREGRNLEVIAHRHRDVDNHVYTPVSEFVTHEVLASREAILAEDVAHDRYLSQRDSISQIGASSAICAPIPFGEKTLGLIHIYCTNTKKGLSDEDLEFTVAVAKQLGASLHQLHRQESLSAENISLRAQLQDGSEMIGESPAMLQALEQIQRVADTHATVLVRGESGVGKELVARAIHYGSQRRQRPFICLNCAAITETLLESELFGHEKGSFTGATEKKVGKFEAAHQGTIFLDEIGEMAVTTQAKLLRVLEGHSFERVGGQTPIRVDVRVVAATNQPLEQAIQEGRFRRDLYFRLQVVEIIVPPLRDRKSDVPLLADHYLTRFVRETGRKIRGFTPEALRAMEAYQWPGNVRELRNVVERAVALGKGPMLDVKDIWLSSLRLPDVPASQQADVYEPMSLDELEKRYLLRTLEHTDWNKSQAAGILQIERSTLDRKIKTYQLKRE